MSKFLTVNYEDIKSAIISSLLVMFLVIGYSIIEAGTIYDLDWKTITSTGIIAGLTFLVSFAKSMFTTEAGKFLGITKIK